MIVPNTAHVHAYTSSVAVARWIFNFMSDLQLASLRRRPRPTDKVTENLQCRVRRECVGTNFPSLTTNYFSQLQPQNPFCDGRIMDGTDNEIPRFFFFFNSMHYTLQFKGAIPKANGSNSAFCERVYKLQRRLPTQDVCKLNLPKALV